MKKEIHPKYYEKAKVICACGNSFTVGSTVPEIQVELCSACHPFYTGKQKLVDTAGRVDKFKQRAAKKIEIAKTRKGKKAKKNKISQKERNKKITTTPLPSFKPREGYHIQITPTCWGFCVIIKTETRIFTHRSHRFKYQCL